MNIVADSFTLLHLAAGNHRFRKLVDHSAPLYEAANSKLKKTQVIAAVVDKVRRDSGVGGFVKKDPQSNLWYEIGDDKARDKVGHAIRSAIRCASRKGKHSKSSDSISKRMDESTSGGSSDSSVDSGKLPLESLDDFWTPLLDELRYCKHIYAMKFMEKVFPPEPSDYPVEIGSMTQWEQNLVDKQNKENETKKSKMNSGKPVTENGGPKPQPKGDVEQALASKGKLDADDSSVTSTEQRKRQISTQMVSLLVVVLGAAACAGFLAVGITSARQDEYDQFDRRAQDLVSNIQRAWEDYVTAASWIHGRCRDRNCSVLLPRKLSTGLRPV